MTQGEGTKHNRHLGGFYEVSDSGLESIARGLASYSCNTEQDLGLKGLILGGLYGLIKAKQLNYVHRTGALLPPGYEAELNGIAATLSGGNVIDDGQWLAGFYFNSALQRLAAGYHRGLQLLTGQTGEVQELLEIAIKRKLLTVTNINWLATAHGEVQKLQRDPYGLLKGRGISLDEATVALNQLLALASEAKIRPI